jgi:hypothetical protein
MYRKHIFLFSAFLLFFVSINIRSFAALSSTSAKDMMMGIPFGGTDNNSYTDICPQGTRVVTAFLNAWANKDFKTMYNLLDDTNKKDYSFDEARFDFEFLEYKEYKISSVRQKGKNYEFILSYGDWQYGDKDTKKILISGSSYKVIMPSRGVLFKKSAESYF